VNTPRSPDTTTVFFGGLCSSVVGWVAAVAGSSFAPSAAVGGWLVGSALVWAVPELRDAVVDRRGHLLVGGSAVLLPLVVAGRARLAGDPVPGGVYAMLAVLSGLVLASAGEAALVDRRVAAGTVLARVDVTTPRTRQFLFHLLGSALTLYALNWVFAAETDLFVLLVGAVTSAVFVGDDDRELVVLEDGLVVGRTDGTGGRLLPWWAVDAVTADGETVRLRQSLPPLSRRRVAASAEGARELADAARRARRRG